MMSKPFNDIHQVEMAVKAAQKAVGNATMNMDPAQLENATKAIEAAKSQLQRAFQHEISEEFVQFSANLLEKLEHQVEEAKK